MRDIRDAWSFGEDVVVDQIGSKLLMKGVAVRPGGREIGTRERRNERRKWRKTPLFIAPYFFSTLSLFALDGGKVIVSLKRNKIFVVKQLIILVS